MKEKDEKLITKLNANINAKANGKLTDGQWTDGTEPGKAYYDYGDKRNDPEAARGILSKIIENPSEWVCDSTDNVVTPPEDVDIEAEFKKLANNAIIDGFLDIVEKFSTEYDDDCAREGKPGKYVYILHTERPLREVIEDAIRSTLKNCCIVH